MFCYECAIQGVRREAVGMCRHCSAGLCEEHAHVEAAPVKTERRNATFGAVHWDVELPRPARRMLCETCQSALHQAEPEAQRTAQPTPRGNASLHHRSAA